MSAIATRIAALPPDKRALLAQRLPPLSFNQHRLWFLDQLEPGSAFYSMPLPVRLRGHLDIPALERSFSEVLSRHEVLRTTFPTIDNQPVQVVTAAQPMRLPLVDLTALSEEEREQRLRQMVSSEVRKPFDLVCGPVWRATLVRLGAEEHVVLVVVHHIVFDGWSSGVLLREVGVLYEAFARGGESPLAELKHQYGDYARWQRQWLTGEVLERQLEYWRKQLRGMPAVLELPTDFPRPAVPSNRGVSQPLEIPLDVFEAVKILCHQEGVTIFMVGLTALKIFLYRYSGRTDILIGCPIAGRSRGETENMIGGFVNIVLLRSILDGDPTCRELLGRIRDVTLGAYDHQDLPFAKLLEELLPGEILGNYGALSAPLFRVVFDLNNTPPGEQLKSPGLEVSLVDTDNKVTGCDVFVSMSENGKSLTGSFLYSYDLFNEDTATRMRTDFQVILRNMVENPDQKLSAFIIQPPG